MQRAFAARGFGIRNQGPIDLDPVSVAQFLAWIDGLPVDPDLASSCFRETSAQTGSPERIFHDAACRQFQGYQVLPRGTGIYHFNAQRVGIFHTTPPRDA